MGIMRANLSLFVILNLSLVVILNVSLAMTLNLSLVVTLMPTLEVLLSSGALVDAINSCNQYGTTPPPLPPL